MTPPVLAIAALLTAVLWHLPIDVVMEAVLHYASEASEIIALVIVLADHRRLRYEPRHACGRRSARRAGGRHELGRPTLTGMTG